MGHGHSHSHQHSSGHSHLHSTGFRLLLTMVLNFVITLAEMIGGVLSGSLSLLSDALHNFSDGISVLLSYLALKLKEREHSYRHTFGLKRAEILAAVINSAVLLLISGYLFYHAFRRFATPTEITGSLMSVVAGIGLLANVLGTVLLHRDSRHSLNIKSAYLHLLSDAISSVGVLLGGLAIIFWKVYWVDPALTILINLYILKESYQILIRAIHILMEGTPPDISLEAIRDVVESLPDVQDIHHIHVWMVGENDIHLEAHVNVNDMKISESDRLRQKIERELRERFNIRHITLQFECNQCRQVGLIHK